MKNLKYFGNYIGVVVQNNDPEKRGRVKVFVPYITPSVYKGWNEVKKDKKFKFLGTNVYSDLTEIIDDLRKILPWAECAAPLAGEASSGRFSNPLQAGSISDSNKINSFLFNKQDCEIDESQLTDFSQNKDNIGEKPANLYDINAVELSDAFNNNESTVNNLNKFSYNYKPESYSNSAKGVFCVPSVGAHLWVFFDAGDPLFPVYFATSYGRADWQSIYESTSAEKGIDYPGEFENKKTGNISEEYNLQTYRNKYVVNQKGGTLSFVNTDNKESVKLSHYSGSFKEFNNFTNIEFASNNDQKLVLGNSFLTIKTDRNEYTEGDFDSIVKGNYYTKVGTLSTDAFEQWKAIVRELADIKQLFDIKRCNSSNVGSGVVKYNASMYPQIQAGNFADCPVCSPSDKGDVYPSVNNSFKPGYQGKLRSNFSIKGIDFGYQVSLSEGKLPQVRFPGPQGTPKPDLSPKDTITPSDGSEPYVPSPGIIFGIECPLCGKSNTPGKSPSSAFGSWNKESKEELIKQFFTRNSLKLAELERKMGLGGSIITEISKHKIETIGLVMNDFGSVRIDDKGKIGISDVRVAKYAPFYNRTPSPVIEYVHVNDLPGGNYTLNICNRFNVLVGSGGINLKTYGPVNISGTITNIAGTQVNIASENEVNIDGGKRFSIIADIISLRQRNKKQVVVESGLGVTRNVVIGGGMYVEGEVFLQHVTAPAEIQRTLPTDVWGAAAVSPGNVGGKIIGFGVPLSTHAVRKTGSEQYNASGGAKAFIGKTDSSSFIGKTRGNQQIGHIPIGAININLVTGLNTNLIPIMGGPAPGATEINCIYGTDTNNIVGSNLGSGGSAAEQMPIVVYGTGRDPDSILLKNHTHLFKNLPLTLKDLNCEVREEAIKNNLHENVAIASSSINNIGK